MKFRLSRPCYDKPHRCPGWAGGGMKFPPDDAKYTCDNGSIRVGPSIWPSLKTPGTEFWERNRGWYPGEHRWRFGRCVKCNVVTLPFALRRLDPTYRLSSLVKRLRRSFK